MGAHWFRWPVAKRFRVPSASRTGAAMRESDSCSRSPFELGNGITATRQPPVSAQAGAAQKPEEKYRLVTVEFRVPLASRKADIGKGEEDADSTGFCKQMKPP